MREMKFDWDDLRLFLAVARSGGLGPASKSTGKSAPTLGRRMLALERRVGQDLFIRHARGYELTEHGVELLEMVEDVEAGVLPIVDHANRVCTPVVKVSAGHWVTRVLCRSAKELTSGDAVRLRFIAADIKLDIGRREAAIGVRNARPSEPGLAGRRVGRVRFAPYAVSPNVESWVSVLSETPSARWVREQQASAHLIEISSAANALDLALSGAACAVLPTFIGGSVTGLERVGPPIAELDHDQWLVTHHEDRFLPEVRLAIESVYEVLKRDCVHRD